MLYDRWREVARARGPELALKDFSDGRGWTFAQLLAWSDDAEAPLDGIVCPRGTGPEFILEVLRGWRHGRAEMIILGISQDDFLFGGIE